MREEILETIDYIIPNALWTTFILIILTVLYMFYKARSEKIVLLKRQILVDRTIFGINYGLALAKENGEDIIVRERGDFIEVKKRENEDKKNFVKSKIVKDYNKKEKKVEETKEEIKKETKKK